MKPEELKFAESHEWVFLADEGGDKVATIGISATAVEALTDLVFMELPAVGDPVTAGDSFGEVESVKATSDIYSPVSGEVVDVNTALTNDLDKLSSDPYGEGWMIKVKLSTEDGLDSLLDFAAYQAQNG